MINVFQVWLPLAALIVCSLSAWYARRERRRLEAILADPVIYVHIETEFDQVYPLDVSSRKAEAMRNNAPWN